MWWFKLKTCVKVELDKIRNKVSTALTIRGTIKLFILLLVETHTIQLKNVIYLFIISHRTCYLLTIRLVIWLKTICVSKYLVRYKTYYEKNIYFIYLCFFYYMNDHNILLSNLWLIISQIFMNSIQKCDLVISSSEVGIV